MRTCKICSIEKPLIKFEKDEKSKGGHKWQCFSCIYKRSYTNQWYKSLLSTSYWRKTVNDREIFKNVEIDSEFLMYLRKKQNGKCYWLNIDIDFTKTCKIRSPSLDRLDNDKGYTKDNVVLTTRFANLGRRDATMIQMKEFIDKYL